MRVKKTMALLGLLAFGISGAIGAKVLIAPEEAAGSDVADQLAPAGSGLKAFVDEEGNLTAPTKAQKTTVTVKSIAPKAPPRDKQVTYDINGDPAQGQIVLTPWKQSVTVATRGPDGTIHYSCTEGGHDHADH